MFEVVDVGCEPFCRLPGLDEGLIPKGFDVGPTAIYAIGFTSAGEGPLLCFIMSVEGLRDPGRDWPNPMGFEGKGCRLTGCALDSVWREAVVGGLDGGISTAFGSALIVRICGMV